MSADMGKLAEHTAKNPVGGAYLKSPKPFPSALPPALIAPPNVESCQKLSIPYASVPPLVVKYGVKPSVYSLAGVQVAPGFAPVAGLPEA